MAMVEAIMTGNQRPKHLQLNMVAEGGKESAELVRYFFVILSRF